MIPTPSAQDIFQHVNDLGSASPAAGATELHLRRGIDLLSAFGAGAVLLHAGHLALGAEADWLLALLTLAGGGPVVAGAWVFLRRQLRLRRATELALLVYRHALEHSSDMVFWVLGDGRLLHVNRMVERRLGYAREELLARALYEIVVDLQVVDWPRLWGALQLRGELRRELRLRSKDGQVLIGDFSAALVSLGATAAACCQVRDLTEHRRVEQALRQSEDLLRQFFESELIGIMRWQDSGAITEANEYFLNLFGFNQGDLRAGRLNWRQQTPLEWMAIDDERQLLAMETGRTGVYEKEFLHRDGSRMSVLVSAMVDASDRHHGIASVVDLTPIKRSQQALRESERRLSVVFASSGDVIILLRPSQEQGLLVELASPSAGDLQARLCLLRTDWRGRPALEVLAFDLGLPAAECERLQGLLGRLLALEAPVQFEHELTRGKVQIWLSVRLTPVRQPDGELSWILLTAHDVTALKEAQQALSRSEERWQLALAAYNDGVWDWNLATDEVFYSPRFSAMYGYDDDELEPHLSAFNRLLHPDDVAPTFAAVKAYLNGEAPTYECEIRMRHKDGSWRLVMTRGVVQRAADGQALRMVGTHADITQRHQQELEREQLLAALTEANRELEGVLYAATHDLRAPLVNLQGFSRRLEQAVERLRVLLVAATGLSEHDRAELQVLLDERVVAAIGYIRASAVRMDGLISALLQLARSGRAERHPQRLDMNQLLEHVRDVFATQLLESNGSLTVTPLPVCYADPQQLLQIFSNLIDNALKYRAPDRPPQLSVSGWRIEHLAHYQVRDNGVGIAPEDQDRVWNLFHRLSPEGSVAGEGLGLALVRRLVLRNRGRIWLESVAGVGSVFHLELPALPSEEPEAP